MRALRLHSESPIIVDSKRVLRPGDSLGAERESPLADAREADSCALLSADAWKRASTHSVEQHVLLCHLQSLFVALEEGRPDALEDVSHYGAEPGLRRLFSVAPDQRVAADEAWRWVRRTAAQLLVRGECVVSVCWAVGPPEGKHGEFGEFGGPWRAVPSPRSHRAPRGCPRPSRLYT